MAATAARPPRRCCWAKRAEADLKPELEIFADDVKCAHGAAVGDLDADSLFYLRARGIPEAEARGMLLQRLPGRRGRGNRGHRPARTGADRVADGARRAHGGLMTAQTKIAAGFDAEGAREDFAILSRTVYGKPLVYLDNGACGAEAAPGAGRDARLRDERICQCPSRRAFPLRRGDRPL